VAKTTLKRSVSKTKPARSIKPSAPSKAGKPSAKAAAKRPKPQAVAKSAPRRPEPKPAAPAAKAATRPINGDRTSGGPRTIPGAHQPVPMPEAVPTDGKPRKNQAGLSMKELEHFRDLLLAKRRELVGDMSSMEREALRSSGGSNLSTLPIHMADMGTDNYEQEFTLGLVETERKLVREINAALAKIQNGTYGICEGTGKPISKPRLEAQPWARFSIEYARHLERGGR
jgi:DnaK suppressor protein